MYISHFPDKDTCPEYINISILHLLIRSVVITKITILGNGNDDDDYDYHRA